MLRSDDATNTKWKVFLICAPATHSPQPPNRRLCANRFSRRHIAAFHHSICNTSSAPKKSIPLFDFNENRVNRLSFFQNSCRDCSFLARLLFWKFVLIFYLLQGWVLYLLAFLSIANKKTTLFSIPQHYNAKKERFTCQWACFVEIVF